MNAYKPLFAHLFGIRLEAYERMTYDDWLTHKAWVDEWLKARQAGG